VAISFIYLFKSPAALAKMKEGMSDFPHISGRPKATNGFNIIKCIHVIFICISVK